MAQTRILLDYKESSDAAIRYKLNDKVSVRFFFLLLLLLLFIIFSINYNVTWPSKSDPDDKFYRKVEMFALTHLENIVFRTAVGRVQHTTADQLVNDKRC